MVQVIGKRVVSRAAMEERRARRESVVECKEKVSWREGAQDGEEQMQRHERAECESDRTRRVAGHWGIGRVCGSDEKRREGEAAVTFRWWGTGGWSER